MRRSILIFATMLSCVISRSNGQDKPHIEWAEIPAGKFIMGSPQTEDKILENERQHLVKISAFRLSKYEITIAQFKAFIDATGYITDAEKETGRDGIGSRTWADPESRVKEHVNWRYDEKGNLPGKAQYDRPVTYVSWRDAKAFADWIGCRLPTEAEWEYACRAGTTTPFNTGEQLTTEQANYFGLFPYRVYDENGLFREHPLPVGSFEPNAWGLYDMHGNVIEYCSDIYEYDYPEKRQKNPVGAALGKSRVARGGSWCTDALDCRSANRFSRKVYRHRYDSGFRIAQGIKK